METEYTPVAGVKAGRGGAGGGGGAGRGAGDGVVHLGEGRRWGAAPPHSASIAPDSSTKQTSRRRHVMLARLAYQSAENITIQ